MPPAPLGISSQSRNKLRAFTFTATTAAPAVAEDDKENAGKATDTTIPKPTPSPRKERRDPRAASLCPQTPAPKIPLADLIGNTEEAFNSAPPVATPTDHVFWQHGPRSSDPSSLFSTQRGKKRARSSSPAPSQPVSMKKTRCDAEGGGTTLRTPQHDPTVDLWARYASVNFAKDGKDDVAPDRLGHLPPSSPTTPGAKQSNEGSFRRTLSCGVEWPTSHVKRRRIDVHERHDKTRDILAASKNDILGNNLPKTSRVGLLVDRIQESLTRTLPAEPAAPSSSSPLPERETTTEKATSPVSFKTVIPDGQQASRHSQHQATPARRQGGSQAKQCRLSSSPSEFADDELDLEAFETVERALSQHPRTASELPQEVESLSNRHVGNESQVVPPLPLDAPSNVDYNSACPSISDVADGPIARFVDEFGEDDDATFAAEMQDLVTKFESQGAGASANSSGSHLQISSSRKPDPAHAASIAAYDNVHDEFDDDDDADIWKDVASKSLMGQANAGVGSGSRSQVCR